MKIIFTKTTPTHHQFEIIRKDGSRESATFETRSLMPHDLIHLAYESTAECKESFYGKLASGTTLAEFGDRSIMSNPENVNTEMILTERITGPLSGYLEKGFSEETMIEAFQNMFSAEDRELPTFLTPELLKKV